MTDERVYGINAVLAAIRSGRARSVMIADRENRRFGEIVTAAERAGIRVERVGVDRLDRDANGGVHQGVVAVIEPAVRVVTLTELIGGPTDPPALIVVLDGIEDPHNVGAILRTADAVGASGVVRQTRHAASLGGAVAKAAAGAALHVRVVDVVNIARALETLKEAGVWAVGLAGEGQTPYTDIDLTLPTALVVGGEGPGLRRLVRERCDWLASIPMVGHVGSLNVSVATGVALFEADRQRRLAKKA